MNANSRGALELEFTETMLHTIDRVKKLHYPANQFQAMVNKDGGVATARRLLVGSGTKAALGLTRLWEIQCLQLSVEAHALLPKFASLFSADEKKIARMRLESFGFDVNTFLNDTGNGLP